MFSSRQHFDGNFEITVYYHLADYTMSRIFLNETSNATKKPLVEDRRFWYKLFVWKQIWNHLPRTPSTLYHETIYGERLRYKFFRKQLSYDVNLIIAGVILGCIRSRCLKTTPTLMRTLLRLSYNTLYSTIQSLSDLPERKTILLKLRNSTDFKIVELPKIATPSHPCISLNTANWWMNNSQ